MSTTAIKLRVMLSHDEFAEDPCENDGWTVYSFRRGHHNSVAPEQAGLVYDEESECYRISPDLGKKISAGLAHMLDYYEHGNCRWSLQGTGPASRWDTSRMAGVLVWEQDESNLGPETLDERSADAASFLDRYTEWCNGNVYAYDVKAVAKCGECGADKDATDKLDFDLASATGYYPDDIEGMVIDIKDQIGGDWENYEVTFQERYPYGLADECRRLWEVE